MRTLALAVCVLSCSGPAKAPAASHATASPAFVVTPKRGTTYHFCGWEGVSNGSVDLDALRPGVSWFTNWSSKPLACPDGRGVGAHSSLMDGTIEFVPMVWGLVNGGADCESGGACFRVDERTGGGVCAEACAAVGGNMDSSLACYACLHEPVTRAEFLADVPSNATHLLGYNEPNFKEQANLSPEEAAVGWRHVQWVADRRDLGLIGPATNFCDPTPDAQHPGACVPAVNHIPMLGLAWLEAFYDACSSEGAAGFDCRIDQQAVHAYSCHGAGGMIALMKVKAGMSASEKLHCTDGVRNEDEASVDCGGQWCVACSDHARAHFAKPVWLTEFGSPADDCGSDDPAVVMAKTRAMLTHDLPLFEADPYIARYAWFMPKVSGGTLGHGDLIVEGSEGSLTDLGKVYLSAQ